MRSQTSLQRRYDRCPRLARRNLSGRFDIGVILRSDALADCCIVFLPVDGVDEVVKPFSFFSSCEPFPRCPVDRSLLGLEIIEERTERREAGILSLAIDALLSPDPGVPRSVVALSAGRMGLSSSGEGSVSCWAPWSPSMH